MTLLPTAEASALYLRDLQVKSPQGRLLLELPALDLPAGALVGIQGASGAGKTTLLMALAGLVTVARGTVRWGQTELTDLTDSGRAEFRAKHIGMIFQDFLLFEELSAQDNARLPALFAARGQRAAIATKAADHLAALGLSDTGRKVSSYSGGERQRVAVARALASAPDIILADEPTAALDRAAADRLIDDLTRMARAAGRTLVVVSHDPPLLEAMDRILTIADGRLISKDAS